MVISCSVPTCKNRFQKGGEVQFHSFPLRREDMSRRWAEAIGRTAWMPTKNSFVCSQHFTAHDYQVRAGKHKHFLRDTAVPTIFSPVTPRSRKGTWRQTMPINKRLPFILPSHLEISCSPLVTPRPPLRLPAATPHLLPATLPSGVSIVPLKKIQPTLSSTAVANLSANQVPRYFDTYQHSSSQSNGIPFKRMKSSISPSQKKNLPILHPSNNTSVFMTSNTSWNTQYNNKQMPNLNPIYQQLNNNNSSGHSDDQNVEEEPRDFDVTQFLSISLQPEEERKANNNNISSEQSIDNLKRKCASLQRELQKRDGTIKLMQFQMKDMRKKMDSISINKILKDNFNGLTLEILDSFLNNTNLDSYEKRYSDKVKEFAMKLYECSEDAYSMVREHFDLPHPSNVTHWLRSNKDQDLNEIGFDMSSGSSGRENCSANDNFESDELNRLNIKSANGNFESDDLNGLNIKMEPADDYE